MKLFLLTGLLCGAVGFLCAQPELVKNVNQPSPFTLGSDPRFLTNINGKLFMAASNQHSGYELWTSDGTADGTVLVKNIAPGANGSGIQAVAVFNNTLFFSGTDGNSSSYQLWKSDGTEEGTVKVKDFTNGGYPFNLTPAEDKLYFTTYDTDHGRELWKTNGTQEGTTLVKDIRPGSESSIGEFGGDFIVINGTLFFTADDGVHGLELWRSDGTPEGTVLVKDISTGSLSSSLFYLTAAYDVLYFNGSDGVHGSELWKSDGTENGTVMVKDIQPGAASSGVTSITPFNDEIYLKVYTESAGSEFWKSDGTEAGTVMVKDINVGTASGFDGYSSDFIVYNGNLYFTANDGINGSQLWKSNGTAEGTLPLKQISVAQNFTEANGLLFFSGTIGNTMALWKTDGTAAGTGTVEYIVPSSGSVGNHTLVQMGSSLYLTADDGIHGNELWKSDGTTEGTVLVKDINDSRQFFPKSVLATGQSVFMINNEDRHNLQIWKSDGTNEGTTLIKNITQSVPIPNSYPSMASMADRVLFIAGDDDHGRELWVSDGTTEGTFLLKDIYPGYQSGSDAELFSSNGLVYFLANDGTHGAELWRSDGTANGTFMLKDIHPNPWDNNTNIYDQIGSGANFYFFTQDFEFWKTDGTPAGTVLIKKINTTNSGGSPHELTEYNGKLFFIGDDGVAGPEIWVSDGTADGTHMIKDIHSNSTPNYSVILGGFNNDIYFTASSNQYDYELWKTNGSADGTVLIKDIYPGGQGSNPISFVALGDAAYFGATDPEHGSELWKTDGTGEGTVLVKDINAGPQGSGIYLSTLLGNHFYFTANDALHGNELWKSDGTADGTQLVYDINNGVASSGPYFTTSTILTHDLFFLGDDGSVGPQLWKYHPRDQFIIFSPIGDKTIIESPIVVSAVAYSGLPVSLSLVSGPAILDGDKLTFQGLGEVTLRASQDGDENYDAAEPIERTFEITKASQVITFEPLTDRNADSSPFDVSATASSGLPVSFTIFSGPAEIAGSTITLKKDQSGSVTVRASQTGDEKYDAAADVDQSFNTQLVLGLEANDQTIGLFPNPASQTLYVNFTNSHGVSEAQLMNSTGQAVWRQHVTNQQLRIPVDHLSKGIYFLRVSGTTTFIKKVVVE